MIKRTTKQHEGVCSFTLTVININYSMLLSKPSLKKKDVSRPDFYKKKRGGRFFLLFTICSRILSKHQILIKHKFVKFWYTQRVSSENSHYFGVYIYIWSFCSSNTLHLRSHISDCISTEPTNLSFAFTSKLNTLISTQRRNVCKN